MVYFKIEPTGCCERKGAVQIRFDFFLEDGDDGYEKRLVSVPGIPPGEQSFKSPEERKAWIDTLPTKTVLVPFHTHFIFLAPTASEEAVMAIGNTLLKEAFGFWKAGEFPALVNATPAFAADEAVKAQCAAKVEEVKNWAK